MAKRKLNISLGGKPELPHRVVIEVGDEVFFANIRYWVLSKPELEERRRDEVDAILREVKSSQHGAADQSDLDRQIATLERVVEQLAPEKGAEKVAELQERILGWDIETPTGPKGAAEPLPCTPENIAQLCTEYTVIFEALYQGLLAASGDARKKS